MIADICSFWRIHMKTVQLQVGDPAPWFQCASTGNPRYDFSSVAGRWVLLAFLGAASSPAAKAARLKVLENRARFDDNHIAFFGVCTDPKDREKQRVKEVLPGLR